MSLKVVTIITYRIIQLKKKDEVIIQALMTLSEEQLMRGTKNKMDSLKDIGIKISYKRLWRICNKYGFLSDIRKRRYPKDYYPKHKQELKDSVVDNILNREFECNKPLTKLCTDITYINIKGGKWLFLNVIIGLCTREIVSYCVSKTIDTKLAIDTLKMKYCDINGCLLHSDQGCTYTSKEFHKFIIENNFIRSMSRKGNCHDNAIVENCFWQCIRVKFFKSCIFINFNNIITSKLKHPNLTIQANKYINETQ